jgi:tRNA nucleotidyltransferase (CCA-adding enzyme)
MAHKLKNPLQIGPVCAFLKELFPPELHHLVWLAGGSVRDTLRNKNIRDIDIVAVIPPATLASLGFNHIEALTTTPIWFRHFSEYGNVEVTRLDTSDCLVEDLQRRDFTLNAMLMSLDGKILDPLDGHKDLTILSLRPCSERVFLDDPIRIFRAFRFEAEGFTVSREAEALLRCRNWDEELAKIPVERFSREMLKALQGCDPGRFFMRMIETGVGSGLLPELFRMPQIPAGPLQHHPEGDLLTHAIQVLERVTAMTPSVKGRFCAFFHDLGKLSTAPELYPKHHGHDEAGFKKAEDFCRRLALPNDYGRALAWTSRLHGNVNRLAELRPATRLRVAAGAVRGGIADLLPLISMADKPGSDIAAEWRELLEVATMNTAALGIAAEQLTAMKAGTQSEFILQKRVEFLKKTA